MARKNTTGGLVSSTTVQPTRDTYRAWSKGAWNTAPEKPEPKK